MTDVGKARVLVVEDAEEIAELVVALLETGGHEARVVTSGAAAVTETRAWGPDVIILDLALPDIDGVEVCRQIRTFSHAYILMLTARSEEIDRVVGLTVGADDYVIKPFSPRELAARVSALLRRQRVEPPAEVVPNDGTRRFGILLVDPQSRDVCVGDRSVELTKIEFDILDALTETPNRVLTRASLRDRVWGSGWFGEDHAVDVHVSNLRKKFAAAGAPAVITTVRGVGYRLCPQLVDAPPQP